LGKSKKKLASSLYINAEKAAEKRKMRRDTITKKTFTIQSAAQPQFYALPKI
jgi:hypothetical protein